MSLERLVAALRGQAEAEARAILTEARARAAALAAETEERVARRRAEVLADREANRRSAVEYGLTDARRTSRRLVLEARSRLLEQVFTEARARFEQVQAGPTYRATLSRQVADVLPCLGDRAVTLRSHPALVPDLERILAGRRSVRVKTDPAVGCGFVAVADDGSVEVDATLEGRLTRSAQELRLEIVGRLADGA